MTFYFSIYPFVANLEEFLIDNFLTSDEDVLDLVISLQLKNEIDVSSTFYLFWSSRETTWLSDQMYALKSLSSFVGET